MRILHTSDWHLGKHLESISRLEEQKHFIDELSKICDEEKVELIIIAGDVYDSFNPSAEAEKLFYSSMKKLSKGGQRPIIVVAGNHDSATRLEAPSPLAEELGIIIHTTPKTKLDIAKFDSYAINRVEEGFFEIEIHGEKASIVSLPFPNEKTLNEIISNEIDEVEYQKDYSAKMGELIGSLSKNFSDETINIIVGHFYVNGGLESDSERKVAIGGSYAVSADVFPENAQYIALGHLHRYQTIKSPVKHTYYSGSPIQYSKSEIGYDKFVNIIDIKPKEEPIVKKRLLTNYKPIVVYKCENYDEAYNKCVETSDLKSWCFLEIKSKEIIPIADLKKLRQIKNDIVEINVIFENSSGENATDEIKECSIEEEFIEFYTKNKTVPPAEKMINLFLEFAEETEEV